MTTYRPRELSQLVREALTALLVVVVTGLRQAGKTTFLRKRPRAPRPPLRHRVRPAQPEAPLPTAELGVGHHFSSVSKQAMGGLTLQLRTCTLLNIGTGYQVDEGAEPLTRETPINQSVTMEERDMKIRRNLRIALLLTAILAIAAASELSGRWRCVRIPDAYCDTECSVVGGSLACFDESNRCCFEGPNSCGDTTECSNFCGECPPGGF